MSGRSVLRRVVALIMIIVGLGGGGRVLWIGYGPEPARAADQLRFLEDAIGDGAAARMQEMFPEGEFFTHVLTGLAEVASAGSADDASLDRARARLASVDDPATLSIFGAGLTPEHGAFAAGWSLALAVDLARASGDPADLDRVLTGARSISTALAAASSPFLASYPGQYWPCDTVVAVAALASAAELLPEGGAWIDQVRRWRDDALARADPGTGLLPHRVDRSGSMIVGPRGSSGTVIQAFWPTLLAATGTAADDQWSRFTRTFVTRQLGLVGIREHPQGVDGTGDVDSGPLVLGVSASASAVGLAAARAAGDDELADALDREAELLGVPLSTPTTTRYGFGLVPVGDAFLVWARTREQVGGAATTAGDDLSARPWWSAYALPGLLVAGLGLLLWRRRSPHQRSVLDVASSQPAH